MTTTLTGSARLKIDLMFEGLRYSEALGAAAEHSFPNYYPYRFQPGEANPTGSSKATIPYLFTTTDGTLVRIKGSAESGWSVQGDCDSGYRLVDDRSPDEAIPITFEPLPAWMRNETSDGFPMAQTGVSLHGDMAVINVAPGCEYFLGKHDGVSMRCTFCSYGAPDERTAHLGQVAGQLDIPELTLGRMRETLRAAVDEADIRHVYLVGGSLTDWEAEGRRFLQLARSVREEIGDEVPVSLGSGALPTPILEQFASESLAVNVCFNLEIWSEALFSQICPGKHRYVGYERWIDSLEQAVRLFGRGRVYSAMVAGIELEPRHGMDWEQASALAIEGADDLCKRGILPIYSLYWPVGGRDHPDYFSRLRNYFAALNTGYRDIRAKRDLHVDESFMCHRCAYMQLECDIDRATGTHQ